MPKTTIAQMLKNNPALLRQVISSTRPEFDEYQRALDGGSISDILAAKLKLLKAECRQAKKLRGEQNESQS